jgi:hypothetical protein
MTTTQETTPKKATERRSAGALTLDQLARMDVAELGALYARGAMPDSLHALDGHPKGRMLAVRGLDRGSRGSLVRRLASAALFPWGGKSFTAKSDTSGRGVNRVHLGGRHQLFPFHTLVGSSSLDRRPCVILDYDLPDNPGFIRAIHDEVREIEAGLFLGPAMLKRTGSHAFVLWFALDTRAQQSPIGDKT